MTWARAKGFNNVPLKDWIDAFERALAATLGHPTDRPVTIKHSYGAKTGMWPPDASICIGRLKERLALRQSKTKGTHDERIPTVERTSDLQVLAEAARVPRKRVRAQAELMAAVQAGEGEPVAAKGKRKYVEMPRTFGGGDTYDLILAAQDAEKVRPAEATKATGRAKAALKKAATAARKVMRDDEHARGVAERKATKRAAKLEKEREKASTSAPVGTANPRLHPQATDCGVRIQDGLARARELQVGGAGTMDAASRQVRTCARSQTV